LKTGKREEMSIGTRLCDFNKYGLLGIQHLFENIEDEQFYLWVKEFSKIIIRRDDKIDQIFLTLRQTIQSRLQRQPSGALHKITEKDWYIQTVKEAEIRAEKRKSAQSHCGPNKYP
jgi:hypothetical protein